MKNFFSLLARRMGLLALVVILAVGFVYGYPYIFSRVIIGEITGAQHLLENTAIISSASPRAQVPSKIFSFAIAVRDHKTSEIVTGSSEDRQWAAVKEGQCARAEFFPYPPWQLDRAGTYHSVRLLNLYDNCELAIKK